MRDEYLPDLLDADRHQLVRAATRLLGPAEAEDAVQDAYVRALENQELELNAAQAWLLTVMRHIAIDRLRRRQWMQQWLAESADAPLGHEQASAESETALLQESTRALRLLADHLPATDGAVVLLHEVFEAEHAEIAQAQGKTAAGSRQQLRRALLRLREAADTLVHQPGQIWALEQEQTEAAEKEALFQLYAQSLHLRDPRTLWAMLRQPPVSASAHHLAPQAALESTYTSAPTPRATASGLVQIGGQLGLALTLDGVTLCVLPLGARSEEAPWATIAA
ncbi:RNA polymerase sigma factor [Hylemonella gracilis]|jgi:RNA polymerase sigma-70 factor (ECF subfamily)|uniref:RNA polymerase sigma factor n=1 Tax=Hylemonella gracilis TaxID=80880 RepID=A0A4P6ULR0_9BURK|nr:sigma-70 family RNA polymerase sigma factor [Hylemonella gracilis]QBK06103.1 RNA polymerase sigma factor [Hylemonella gracilis]